MLLAILTTQTHASYAFPSLKERAALGHDLAIFHLVHEPDNDPLRPGFPGGVT
jgi:hypothetical protein